MCGKQRRETLRLNCSDENIYGCGVKVHLVFFNPRILEAIFSPVTYTNDKGGAGVINIKKEYIIGTTFILHKCYIKSRYKNKSLK